MVAIQYLSKVDLAYQEIRRQIIDGTLRPGERLLIQSLAHRLGTSAGPVRESFRRLEAEGLVVIQPHVGATVALVDLNDTWQAVLTLAVLAGLAGRLAAATTGITNDDLATLSLLINDIDDAVRQNRLADAAHLDQDFHRIIGNASGSRRLANLIENLLQPAGCATPFYEQIPGHAAQSNSEHKHIFQALEAHDPEAAESRLRGHVEEAGRRRIAWLKNHQSE